MTLVLILPTAGALVLVVVLVLGVALRRPAVTGVGECRHPEGEPCPHHPRPALLGARRALDEAPR